MKHLLTLSLSLVCVCILACSKSSDAAPKQQSGDAPKPALSDAVQKQASSGAAHNHSHDAAPRPPYTGPSPMADSLTRNFYVEPCCAGTLGVCLKQKPGCAIAPRLAGFLAWLDSTRLPTTPEEKVVEALNKRHNMFKDKQKHAPDTKGWPTAGDANAPVTVVMFFSGTCPTCKHNYRDLYAEITKGALKGKVKLVAKPLNIHVSNRAAIAAHDLGGFTSYMLALAEHSGHVDENAVFTIADRLYFDRDRFKAMVENPELIKHVETASKEADQLGVTHVPTYFINGRRYDGVLTVQWIGDAVDYVLETELQKK